MLPLNHYLPGPGVLVSRYSWQDDAVYFGTWAGPLREGHQHRAANEAHIEAGGSALISSAAYWSHGGVASDTEFCWGYLRGANRQGQYWREPTNEDNRLTVLHQDGAMVVTEGQGRAGYNHAIFGFTVRDYTSRKLYDGNRTVVVYDRFVSVDPNEPRVLRLHGREISTVDRVFTATSYGGTWKARVALLRGLTNPIISDIFLGVDPAIRSSQVTEYSVTEDLICYAIQTCPIGEQFPPLNTVVAWDGHEAICGGYTLVAPDGPLLPDETITPPPPGTPPPGGTPVPVTPRENSTTKVYFEMPVGDFQIGQVEGLPPDVEIAKIEIVGVQNTGWKWQNGFPPGAEMEFSDDNSFSWQIKGGAFAGNPNTSYTAHIVGSDGFEDASLPVEVRPAVPPPGDTVTITISRACADELKTALQ